MHSFHIWYKWSLAWEGVSHVMTFDLDLYLQGHSTLFWLGIQHDSIVWVIMRRRGYPQNEGVRTSCSSLGLKYRIKLSSLHRVISVITIYIQQDLTTSAPCSSHWIFNHIHHEYAIQALYEHPYNFPIAIYGNLNEINKSKAASLSAQERSCGYQGPVSI